MLVSVRGHGLFRSRDGGQSFTPVAEDLIAQNQVLVSIHFTATTSPDGRAIYALSEEGLFESSNSGESWQVIHRPARYESSSNTVKKSGEWNTIGSQSLSEMTAIEAHDQGDFIEFTFQGNNVAIVGRGHSDGGIAAVSIDGTPVGEIDLYRPSQESVRVRQRFTGLDDGLHRLRVEVTGRRSPGSNGTAVTLDAFDIE